MPRIEETIEIDIEVYCATCGSGLCGQSTVTKTYNRGVHSVRVEVCDECIQNAISDVRHDLEDKIDELEGIIVGLKEDICENEHIIKNQEDTILDLNNKLNI